MAILNLIVEDIGSGHIRVQIKSDIVDIDSAPVTPAMMAMAAAMDTIMALNEMALQQTSTELPNKEKVH